MKEQLITFDTAKLAKEKGFDWGGEENYSSRSGFIMSPIDYREDWSFMLEIQAPTQSLLQKWLREVHNIDIVIHHINTNKFESFIYRNISHKKVCRGKSYEDALEIGLQEGLKLIK